MEYLKKYKNTIIPALILVLGIILGYFLRSAFDKDLGIISKESRSGGYKLINPLFECISDQRLGKKEFGKLEERLLSYINDSTKHENVDRISVYFRDLNNGPWFGINEDATFSPSSLLKLPVAIAFYKKAESDPSLLTKKVKYDGNFEEEPISQNFKPKNSIIKDQEYTIEELISKMIINSDNSSLYLLLEKGEITDKEINRISEDLEIPTTNGKSATSKYMSVKNYSSLLRVLYNSSYLDRKYSEKILELLTRVDFSEGLRKPIPKEITIANKFGERRNPQEPNSPFQLHDCGIVYYTDHPYLLCVMSQGNDFNSLLKTIQEISKEVYEEHENRYR